jgi:hypothetical protein
MEKSFNFIVEADITHLFKAKQERTFDLKCKPLSRYMLAQRLLTPTAAGEQLIPNTPIFDVFNAAGADYAPVANFSTRDVKVSIGVQGDLVAMFNYTCRGFSWDLGYNFWAMSSSKISVSCDDDCDTSCGIVPFPVNTWALKGDASVAGFTAGADFAFGLGATESAATIFTGTNIAAGTGLIPVTTPPLTAGRAAAYLTNPNIDTPRAQAQGNIAGTATPLFAFSTDGTPSTPFAAPINTTTTPVFISIDDLDVAGAEQRGLSHKIFTHFNYTWLNHERWVPYVGAGVSAEFGSHSGHDDCPPTTTTIECDTCPSSLSWALSRWAVEIKGGVSFH